MCLPFVPAVWSLFTFLTPAAAAAGTLPLLAARVMLGVGEGVAFPAIHSLIGERVWVGGRLIESYEAERAGG